MDLLVPQENRFVCNYTVTGVLAKSVHTVDSFSLGLSCLIEASASMSNVKLLEK